MLQIIANVDEDNFIPRYEYPRTASPERADNIDHSG
jgi:hypothetical protein